jgi:NAD(P)-dependent dehydrogenase (short-subunit alcohol dehydrogenase family)
MDETSSIEALIAAVERVDVLVNNAGTAIRAPESLTPEGFEKNIAVNLNAVFRLSQGLHKKLARKPGCIINVASMFSFFGSARVPGYEASKAGVVQLTKTLASLYAADGIRVNAIAPGWVETKLTEGIRGTQALSRPIMERTPLGRWSRPEEMAGTALYLACDELAGFVTGATIPIDGGFSAN